MNLFGNNIGDVGVEGLVDMFESNKILIKLNLF